MRKPKLITLFASAIFFVIGLYADWSFFYLLSVESALYLFLLYRIDKDNEGHS